MSKCESVLLREREREKGKGERNEQRERERERERENEQNLVIYLPTVLSINPQLKKQNEVYIIIMIISRGRRGQRSPFRSCR